MQIRIIAHVVDRHRVLVFHQRSRLLLGAALNRSAHAHLGKIFHKHLLGAVSLIAAALRVQKARRRPLDRIGTLGAVQVLLPLG